MIIYNNEVINPKNIAFIKVCFKALDIHFIGGTNHWLWFDDEKSKIAILTSIELQMK